MNPVDVDIDDVLTDVAGVLAERETGRGQEYRSEVREAEDIIYLLPGAWQNISDSLLSLDQSLAPLGGASGTEEPAFGDRARGAFKGLVKRAIQKSVYWYVNPLAAQLHSVQSSAARAMREIAGQLKGVADRLELLEKENLDGRLRALEGERFEERIGRLERTWRQVELSAGDALRAPGVERTVESGEEGAVAPAAVKRPSRGLHFDYYWFESIHRGDRELIKRRQQPYLVHFERCSNVLDIGCGRGEFLELMAEKGIGGYGIDIEDDAVRYCADRGLSARLDDAIEHLSGLGDDTLDGVFISQVVEHMTPDELIEMVGLIYRKMMPGGYVVIETPNPQCLLIFASFFYADLSHVQPIHPETTRFLLLSAGFREVEIELTNPVPKSQRLSRVVVPETAADEPWVSELNSNLEKLNSVLFSHMDYAAVARK